MPLRTWPHMIKNQASDINAAYALNRNGYETGIPVRADQGVSGPSAGSVLEEELDRKMRKI